MIDRIMSLFKPVKRYHCDFCDWEKSLLAGSAKQTGKK